VGDFNLEMKTKAVCDLENAMKNLVKEYGFTTTRNHYYENYVTVPFSDYAFVSNDVEVKNFEVLQDEVSDHLALSLEFELI
jgi:endonuclease/exonuclease/phosphatase family metal-dependent hydrolase